MDQFNKVLAIFLVLFVALGLSAFVFIRLGLLDRFTKPNSTTTTTTQTAKKTVSITPSVPQSTITPSTTQKKEEGGSLLGFLFARKNTPTPSQTPTNIPKQNQEKTIIVEQSIGATKGGTQISPPDDVVITVIPYGSAQPTQYPASGSSHVLIFIALTTFLLGSYLKAKT